MDGPSIDAVRTALLVAGARTHRIAPHLGLVKPTSGGRFGATGTPENIVPSLFGGLVLSDGIDWVSALCARIDVTDFISNQCRHCQTHRRARCDDGADGPRGHLGDATQWQRRSAHLDGLSAAADQSVVSFIAALGRHRHPERTRGGRSGALRDPSRRNAEAGEARPAGSSSSWCAAAWVAT